MTYYINPIWFYLMNISTGIRILTFFLGGVSLAFSVIVLISIIVDECGDITDLTDDEKKILKIFKKIIIASIILLFIGVLVPSKDTCIEMMIASQVTHENVISTKKEIYEIVDYITDKVNREEEE